jgi:hypothetical protein
MGKNSFKGRIILKVAERQRVKVDEPYSKQQRPSLKGRIHKLPKTAFWQRMSGWPLTKSEEGPVI